MQVGVLVVLKLAGTHQNEKIRIQGKDFLKATLMFSWCW